MNTRDRIPFRDVWCLLSLLAVLLVPSASGSLVSDGGGRGAGRVVKKSKARKPTKAEKLRRDLHRNLDGKGDGFISGWRWQGAVFTLIIDPSRYAPNKVLAATVAVRAMFETADVALPETLVIRDMSGTILGSGPFANVPSLSE
jgi:hypothetical protein